MTEEKQTATVNLLPMEKFKTAFLVLNIIILLFLAAGGGYYWSNRQFLKKFPTKPVPVGSCPPCSSAEMPSSLASPLFHSSLADWLEGITPEMMPFSNWCVGIGGELQNLTKNSLEIQESDILKELVFNEDLLIEYQKIFVESDEVIPASKEEIQVGDRIILNVCFNTLTGEAESLSLNKLVFEEEIPTTPVASPSAAPDL